MKLRLRSLESKETLKLEVPNSCSLQQLKDTLSRAISSSSSSSSSSPHLSLNRKDEIHASSPHETLHSIGITAGDLVFYTLNPNAFSLETLLHKPGPSQIEPTNPTPQETNPRDEPMIQDSSEIDTSDDALPGAEKSLTLDAAEGESMDFDDGSGEVVVVKSNSEPSFVKRVLREALCNDVTDLKLLVFAVHAVILESGFVRADRVSGMAVGCSHLLDDWPSATASTISLSYTLPEILTNGSGTTQTVFLKFQTLGHLVNVYGSLSDAGSALHRVCLDKCKFARALELMLANSESKGSFSNEVFELWKMVKDGLALPLLIDLCEKAGLGPPPCFMRLPTELKLKILECLPGVDVAKVACLCSELRYLSSGNELWKQKFEEEFGHGSRGKKGMMSFKDLFAIHWETKKKSEQPVPFRELHLRAMRFFPMPLFYLITDQRKMAFMAAKNWRLMLTQLGGGRRSFATSTIPKMKPMSPAIDAARDAHSTSRMSTLKAEFAPVYIVCGMVCVALTIGSHTAFQQLARSPTVHVNKKRRESMPEVYDPDRTINSANKFINGSFFRKMSHVQENNTTLHDPVHPNPFTHPRTAETLKTVGIEPSRH